jgi:hypothetical protein
MMPAASRQRTVGISVALGVLALVLSGCGNVTGVGADASAGHGGGGASGQGGSAGVTGAGGTSGTGGTGGSTGAGGTSGAAGSGGATGRGGSGATGLAGADGTGSGGRGGGAGVAGGGGAGRGGTTGGGGATAGRGGTTGTGGGGAGRGGTTGVGGGSGGAGGLGRGGTLGTGGIGQCATILCTVGRTCCVDACVNLNNDPFNCGKCGNVCEAATPYCDNGTCGRPPCTAGTACIGTATCCGTMCCGAGELCCEEQGPLSRAPVCHKPTAGQPTCPAGCAPECRSDRNQKKSIAPVDTRQILDKVARLPISTWSYVEEPSAVRHLGPMAQDFRASFGLGNDDRSYNSVDAHGVALAAIQALERMVAAQEKRITNLERENRRLERRLCPNDSRPAR